MLSKIFAFIMELFRSKPKKQIELESKKEVLEEKLEDINDETIDHDVVNDYLN